jgi:hypothetical protein
VNQVVREIRSLVPEDLDQEVVRHMDRVKGFLSIAWGFEIFLDALQNPQDDLLALVLRLPHGSPLRRFLSSSPK